MNPDEFARMINPVNERHYRQGCKDTVARFIEIIHRRQEEREALHDKGDWDNGYLNALEAVECEVMVMEGTE